MKTTSFARTLLLSLALGVTAPSFALPLMDMRSEDLLAMAPDVVDALKLNANQQTLYRQVEGRTRAILRERRERREQLQQQAKALLDKPDVELRALGKLIDAEAATSAAEDRQLREAWLTLNDALDDGQRRKVATFVAEQMMRVQPEEAAHGEGRGEGGRAGGRRGGMGRGRMGGGMGMPGE
jgi:hypothetical protein